MIYANLNSKIILFLISILPLSLLTGSFLSDLSISISSVLLLVYFIITNEKKYFRIKIIILFFIWCSCLILRSLFSDNIYLSLESSLFYFRFGFLSLSILYLISIKPNFPNYFFIVSCCMFFIVTIDSIIQFYTGENIFGFKYTKYRVSSFFNDELILGSYLSKLIIINFAILFIFLKKNYLYINLYFLLFPIVFILVLLSGERTAVFNLILLILFFFLFIKDFNYIKILLISFILILLSFLILTENSVKERIYNHTFSTNQINLYGEDRIKLFSITHEHHYISAFKMFKDNISFGIGPKMFREVCSHDKYYSSSSCSTHPHNYYIQLLSETGILGAIPVFLLFFYIIFIFIKGFYLVITNQYKSDYQTKLISFMPLGIFLFPFVPSGNFFHNWSSIFIYISFGFMLNIYFKRYQNL